MGYYTNYDLTVENAMPDEEDKIKDMLDELGVIGYALGHDFYSYDAVKWYDYAGDMVKISKAFPNVHFILHGEGEYNNDIWEQHFIGGKTARYDAVITIPPLNPDDLR